MKIWCPACGCDVRHLLTQKHRDDAAQVKADQRKIQDAIRHLRKVVKTMARHAERKTGVMRPVSDIYRLWSDELLREIAKQFPAGASSGVPPVKESKP